MATEVSLTDAKGFFEQIVKPSVNDFLNTPSEFRTAFNAATALFHMHEWLYEFKQPELEAKYGQPFAFKGAFWDHVETLVQSSKFVRDLANASKHVRLALRPSTIRLIFEDEARIGQKGRACHRWYTRGKRPPGRADQRYTFGYVFAAVEPGTDKTFALVVPEVSTSAMQIYLDKLSATIGVDEHVLLVLDQAAWHGANDLMVPANNCCWPPSSFS